MNEITSITASTAASSDGNVYTALAAAQAEMQPITKGSVNTHFKNRYADLADVAEGVRAVLSRHGLAFFHVPTECEGGGHAVKTVLAHGASGTFIEAVVPLIGGFNNMQGYKSATTYAKRIGLESVTGVAPDDDDDGNAQAEQAKPREDRRQEPRAAPVQQEPPAFSEADVRNVIARLSTAETIPALQEAWSHAGGMQQIPTVLAAKDARKAVLTASAKPTEERWPGDAAQRPLVDDHIPY